MPWGASIVGVTDVLDLFEDISVRWTGDATYIAGPTVNYAVYQEKGTSSIEARPFMQPAAGRVNANTGAYIERIATSQGMDITTQEDAVRAAALAVQAEGKRIADEKDVRDTGALIASITIAKVR